MTAYNEFTKEILEAINLARLQGTRYKVNIQKLIVFLS